MICAWQGCIQKIEAGGGQSQAVPGYLSTLHALESAELPTTQVHTVLTGIYMYQGFIQDFLLGGGEKFSHASMYM